MGRTTRVLHASDVALSTIGARGRLQVVGRCCRRMVVFQIAAHPMTLSSTCVKGRKGHDRQPSHAARTACRELLSCRLGLSWSPSRIRSTGRRRGTRYGRRVSARHIGDKGMQEGSVILDGCDRTPLAGAGLALKRCGLEDADSNMDR